MNKERKLNIAWTARFIFGTYLTLQVIFLFTGSLTGQEQTDSGKDETSTFDVGYSNTVFEEINAKDAIAVSSILSVKIVERYVDNSRTETSLYTRIEDIDADLRAHRLDLIALTTYEYLILKEQWNSPLIPIAVGEILEESIYNYYLLIVRKDSGIQQISDLQNQSIIVQSTKAYSITELWLENMLQEAGLPRAAGYFSSVTFTTSTSKTLMPVFFKNLQACIVREPGFNLLCELNPQIMTEMTILERSPGLMHTIICIRGDLSEDENRSIIEKNLLRLHEDPEGKELLKIFRVRRMVRYQDRFIDDTVKLINSVKQQ